MERQAETIFTHLDDLGNGSILEGVYTGIENGYFIGAIADSAYRYERAVNTGDRTIVGVNAYTDGTQDDTPNLLRIDHHTETEQRARLETIKTERNTEAVHDALTALAKDAADPNTNLMPALINTVHTYATEEEIAETLRTIFGTHTEHAIV